MYIGNVGEMPTAVRLFRSAPVVMSQAGDEPASTNALPPDQDAQSCSLRAVLRTLERSLVVAPAPRPFHFKGWGKYLLNGDDNEQRNRAGDLGSLLHMHLVGHDAGQHVPPHRREGALR